MSSLRDIMGDRAKMEAERLARNAKKRSAPAETISQQDMKRLRRSISPPALKGPAKAKTGPAQSLPPSQLPGSKSQTINPASPSTVEYPTGALKKTWCFGYDRNGLDIKIEEVLRKRDLKIAVLSSWQIDMEWLMAKLDTERTNIVLVYGEKDPQRYDEHRAHAAASAWGRNVRLSFPPMSQGPYTCMHSKLMLLFYGDSMRIAIPSANLLGFDWGESGVMENSVFLIDLPRLPDERQGAHNNTLDTPFAREVCKFVEAKGVDKIFSEGKQNITEGTRKFDWSATGHIAFVHTIGQTFYGQDTKSTGLNQLSKSVRELGLSSKPGQAMQVDYSASSIGALTDAKAEAMFRALRGIDQETPGGPASAKSKASTASNKVTPESTALEKCFRVHFPSHDNVVNRSKGGPENAGTQFMTPGWEKPAFPLKLLRDFDSRRPGCLSHNKFMVVRTATSAFVYSGSANFSQSAWGSLTYDRSKKTPKLTCGNWECGVLVKIWPPETQEQAKLDPDDVSTASESESEANDARTQKLKSAPWPLDGDGVLPLDVFEGKVDIPYRIPGKPYKENNLKPWIQPQRR